MRTEPKRLRFLLQEPFAAGVCHMRDLNLYSCHHFARPDHDPISSDRIV